MGYQKNDDYIEVPERIAEFRTKYPEGSLQPWDKAKPYEVVDLGGVVHIIVVAAAYRSPDDPLPGVGMAQEVVPGKTPYTKGSELMNAETSAWGRAIVAALAADTKRGIASAEEVRNRQAERDVPDSKPAAQPKPEDAEAADLRAKIIAAAQAAQFTPAQVTGLVGEAGGKGGLNTETDLAVLRAVLALIPPF
ncbi:hypothetical protein [Rhodococcus sp. RCBS9]|uniref:hypothetical protein n=1 Tax=Rhodococcus sp. RCBS9 TaxID=3031999 RepID=UPI0024026BE5|nr:hypothetical protein [Rhodococcus sp. RCBS9]WEX03851.1 hypothetical protein P0M12_30320 [Rhodococcus sp. RCBS9]WEX03930.1 hypothetical protein P0M12_00335 [Rhodococcus sp. RCBS9]